MVADKGLGETQFVDEVTDAEVLCRKELEDPPPNRIANQLCQLGGRLGINRHAYQRR